MSVAYLAEPGQFERDSSMPSAELLHFPPHMDKLTLTVVEDRNYRAPRNRFPLNLLRNVAIEAAPAELILVLDVDFVVHPSGAALTGHSYLRPELQ